MGGTLAEYNTSAPIIGDKVVIWANATVVGGIKIGDNAVIGANSVVIRDVEPNTVVAGNPAREIRKTKDGDYLERNVCYY